MKCLICCYYFIHKRLFKYLQAIDKTHCSWEEKEWIWMLFKELSLLLREIARDNVGIQMGKVESTLPTPQENWI